MYIQTICKPFSINALGQCRLIIANFISIENFMLLAVLLLNIGYLHSRVYLIPPLRSFCYTAVPPQKNTYRYTKNYSCKTQLQSSSYTNRSYYIIFFFKILMFLMPMLDQCQHTNITVLPTTPTISQHWSND